MNRIFGDQKSAEMTNPNEHEVPAARQTWVKPALERLSLNEALGGNPHLSLDATTGGGS